jgi:small subunit ribosomal protein S8
MARKKEVTVPCSRIKVEIAKILKDEGFIKNYKVIDDNKQGLLQIWLKYTEDNKNVISGLERVSRPGCRIYCTKETLPTVMSGLGLAIISTSKGILTDKKCRELGVGGEIICKVW